MPKIITLKTKNLTYCFKNIVFRFGVIILCGATALGSFTNVYAANSEGEGITFSAVVSDVPVMEVTLEAKQLLLNLTPQMASADFQPTSFEVTVGTSNKTGYTLNMTATSTNLTRTEAISGETPVIATLDTDETNHPDGYSVDDFTLNRWGFRKGLLADTNPMYLPINSTNLLASNDAATNGIKTNLVFAAKVDATQPAGTYNTTLNFVATANPTVSYLQDLNPSLCVTDSAIEAIDSRDEQTYTVQRLADGKCWMTKNLNLAGGTEIESTKSDVPSGWSLSTTQGFLAGNKLPNSSTSFDDDAKAFVNNNDNTTCADKSPCYSYYSWIAATAGGKDTSGSVVTADNTDAAYSICPKGWRLPRSRSMPVAYSDFYVLATKYGMSTSSTSQSTANFYNQAGPGTTPNFLLTGYYYGGSLNNGGIGGYYWPSTSRNSTIAYALYFTSSYVDSAGYFTLSRKLGFGVRCILRES